MGVSQRVFIRAAVVIAVIGLFLWASWQTGPWMLLSSMFAGAVDRLTPDARMRPLVQGVVLLVGLPFAFAVLRLSDRKDDEKTKMWPKSRRLAELVGLVYLGVFFLATFWFKTAFPFAKDSHPLYCPIGGPHFFEKIRQCPRHGLPLVPLTPEEAIRLAVRGNRPTRHIDVPPDGPFCDIATGTALIFFGHDAQGRLIAYDGPGFDPVWPGDSLLTPTKESVRTYQAQATDAVQAEPRREPTPTGGEPQPATRTPTPRSATGQRPGQPKVEMAPPPVSEASSTECDDLAGLIRRAQMESGNADLDLRIGACLERQGNVARALNWYRMAQAANPNLLPARDAVKRLESRQ
jgi:hypothetical protein